MTGHGAILGDLLTMAGLKYSFFSSKIVYALKDLGALNFVRDKFAHAVDVHLRGGACNQTTMPKFGRRSVHGTHTHTRLTALFPGVPRSAGTRKAKPIWILLEQETVSGSGISWAICKSASRSRQITMPVPHHSIFYRPDALPAAQPTVSKHGNRNKILQINNEMPSLKVKNCRLYTWDMTRRKRQIFKRRRYRPNVSRGRAVSFGWCDVR